MYSRSIHDKRVGPHYLPPPVVVLCELHQLLVELVAVYGHVVLVEGVLEHEVGVEDVDLLEHLIRVRGSVSGSVSVSVSVRVRVRARARKSEYRT